MAHIIPYGGLTPRVHRSAFIAPTAVLIGDVVVEAEASIWFGAVLRGDNPACGIRIGPRCSIQDNCVLHVSERGDTVVGEGATIGHGAVFESCRIGARALVGMNAVILHEADIGEESLVAALAVVPEGMRVPPRTLVAGAPARVRKDLGGESADWIRKSADHYVALSRSYLAEGIGRVPDAESGGPA